MGLPQRRQIDSHQFWLDTATGRTFNLKKDIPAKIRDKCEHWDSELEYRVHQQLLKLSEYDIYRQQNLLVLPASTNFKAWTWNIDFIVQSPQPIYIEAKGKWLLNHMRFESFWKTLRVLELFHPQIYNNLLFVGSNKDEQWTIPQTKITVYPINCLPVLWKKLSQI